MAGYAGLSSGPLGKRERYQQLRDSLWTERSTFDSHWRELGDFLVPTRTRFSSTQRNQGGKRTQNIIDSTARYAWRTLRSGMHAGITSPARPWFKLTTPDPDLAEFKPVEAWLHTATTRMQTVFSSANLYNVLPVAYGDIGGFGVGSHLTWQLLGGVQYDVSSRWSLSAGWRHLDINYDHKGFVFDAAMDGPILGAVYKF